MNDTLEGLSIVIGLVSMIVLVVLAWCHILFDLPKAVFGWVFVCTLPFVIHFMFES